MFLLWPPPFALSFCCHWPPLILSRVRVRTWLPGDGAKDLLVTSQGTSGSGRVLAYEAPAGWATGAPWTKRVLADGYKPLKVTSAPILNLLVLVCGLEACLMLE